MKLTDIFSLLGGLALFLYGMQMMGGGLEAAAGNKMKKILEKFNSQPFSRSIGWRRDYGGYSIIVGNYSHGCRFCQLRYDDAPSGCLDYHGRQYRHDYHRTVDCSGYRYFCAFNRFPWRSADRIYQKPKGS